MKASREEALKVARLIGCTGVHQDSDGKWLPCSSAEKLQEISNEAESLKNTPKAKSEEKKKKRGSRRRYVKPGYEPLGERGVLGIETLPDGGLVSGKDAEFEEHELIELKAESYTKPRLRESIKRRIMAGSRGGKPGEWSARKAQLLAIEYRRAGGGYRGGKKKPQRSLDKWTSEEWTTSDGKPAIREGGTTRYLPEKAWQKLTPAQREATNRKKRRASQQGRQFVANTDRAREAGAKVRNAQKSMIINRAKPRRGDPDVYDDADSARLRARSLGCIGIARQETQDGDYVWTPCTNISDYRRQTGQSVSPERDRIRRLQRKLRKVGDSSHSDARNSKTYAIDNVDYKSVGNVNESVVASLAEKVSSHNSEMRSQDKPNWSMANVDKLKTVYSRGLSAYTKSGPKNISSDQWALARVNAFLRILKSGQPTNKKYVIDNDLLHEDHPWKKRSIREKTRIDTEAFEIKALPFRRLGNAIGALRGRGGGRGGGGGSGVRRRFGFFDRFARDADRDGRVQEGTQYERPATPDSSYAQFAQLLQRVKDPDGGFTYSMSNMDDVRSGWAIARKGKGIRLSVDKIFDKDGQLKEDGIDHLQAFMFLHQDAFNQQPDNKRRIALGAWHNPDDGQIYFDVTDVYSKKFMDVDQAKAEARKQNQISVADLDELHAAINNNDWENRTPFHDGGGNGEDLLPQSQYDMYLKAVANWRAGKPSEPLKPRRLRRARNEDKKVEVAEDRVAMMLASPIKDLAAYHKDKRNWAFVRALPAEERKRIADAYDDAPDLPASEIQEEARQAYEALVKEVEQQYDILIKELKIKIEFTDDDPYENYFDMRDDFIENRRLKILKTSVTGGHPFLTDEQNDKFRAVHDAFGHLATGRGFDRHGEEAAYQAHKSMFGPLAVKAAATELRGQNSFLLDRGFFGPQKLVILPSDMRKFLLTLLATKQDGQGSLVSAQKASDNDNAYTKTGSHHVSCGRTLRS